MKPKKETSKPASSVKAVPTSSKPGAAPAGTPKAPAAQPQPKTQKR